MVGWVPELPASGQSWWRVDEVVDLEAVARRWLGKPSVLTKEQHEGIGVNTDSKFLIGRVGQIAITCNPLF